MNETPDLDRLIATALWSFARAAVAAGLEPAAALRLSSFAVIESSLGREATRGLGLPESTARRWRAELANMTDPEEVVTPDLSADLLTEVLGFSGFPDLRVQRKGVTDDVQEL